MKYYYLVLLVISATFITALGNYLLKKAASVELFKIRHFFRNNTLLYGFGLHALSSSMFIYALRSTDLSILYPLFSLNYVWVILLSWKILKEKMNIYKVSGTIFIVLGIIVVNLK